MGLLEFNKLPINTAFVNRYFPLYAASISRPFVGQAL